MGGRRDGQRGVVYLLAGFSAGLSWRAGVPLHAAVDAALIAAPTLVESQWRFARLCAYRKEHPTLRASEHEQASARTLDCFTDLAWSLREGGKRATPWTLAGVMTGYAAGYLTDLL